MTDELMTVSVLVPRNRLSELYNQCGAWVRDIEAPDESASLWEGDEDKLLLDAQTVYLRVSSPARGILDFLIDHPGEKFTATDLVTQAVLGFEDESQLTGSLSSITRRSKDIGRDVPHNAEDGFYWINPKEAGLFRQARKNAPKRRGRAQLQQQPRGRAHLQHTAREEGPQEVPMVEAE